MQEQKQYLFGKNRGIPNGYALSVPNGLFAKCKCGNDHRFKLKDGVVTCEVCFEHKHVKISKQVISIEQKKRGFYKYHRVKMTA